MVNGKTKGEHLSNNVTDSEVCNISSETNMSSYSWFPIHHPPLIH